MRLPLQHPPPAEPPPRMRCEYLTRLLRAAVGLPLGPAAGLVASSRSRGRHGNALEWHLGLEGHDARAEPDWEGRIEIKLVTVSRRAGAITCDKLKVCDAQLDPWRKLANTMFVLADRLTRTVVGHRLLHLDGPPRDALVRAWSADPHFDAPELFVESREQAGVMSPAYYVAASWLLEHVVPAELEGVVEAPRREPNGGEPVLTVTESDAALCPRCRAPLRFDPAALARHGAAPAHHGMPLLPGCAARSHVVVSASRVCRPALGSVVDQHAALHGLLAPDRIARLAELVAEPDDHQHA